MKTISFDPTDKNSILLAKEKLEKCLSVLLSKELSSKEIDLLTIIRDNSNFNDWCDGWNSSLINKLINEKLIKTSFRNASNMSGDCDITTANITSKGLQVLKEYRKNT